MAKSYLVRKGMRPLTQGFADAYRAWLDNWTKRNKRFNPLGKDVTPEQRETINKMVERLEEFDDVQTVYTNMKPEEGEE